MKIDTITHTGSLIFMCVVYFKNWICFSHFSKAKTYGYCIVADARSLLEALQQKCKNAGPKLWDVDRVIHFWQSLVRNVPLRLKIKKYINFNSSRKSQVRWI